MYLGLEFGLSFFHGGKLIHQTVKGHTGRIGICLVSRGKTMILAMVLDSGVSFLISFSDYTQILPTFLEEVYAGPSLKGVVSNYSELPFHGQDEFYLMVNVTQNVAS